MKLEDYFKYYIQGSDHYLIPKDVFKELFNEMVNWKEESQKQKEAKRVEAIDYMNECGYFYLSNIPEHKLDEEHATRNYLKVKTFIERGIIPDWLQEDLKYYYDKMRHSQYQKST